MSTIATAPTAPVADTPPTSPFCATARSSSPAPLAELREHLRRVVLTRAGGYWLLGALGHAIGSGALLRVTLGCGLGVWSSARREYLRRPPGFDAPLG